MDENTEKCRQAFLAMNGREGKGKEGKRVHKGLNVGKVVWAVGKLNEGREQCSEQREKAVKESWGGRVGCLKKSKDRMTGAKWARLFNFTFYSKSDENALGTFEWRCDMTYFSPDYWPYQACLQRIYCKGGRNRRCGG